MPHRTGPPRRSPFPATRRVPALAAVTLAALAALAACGDPPDEAPRGGGRTRDPRVAAASPESSARFALRRLTNGPPPRTDLFEIPDLHRLTVEQAVEDLVSLPQETLALLADPDTQERFAGPSTREFNPLHGILDALAAIDPKPADVAVRWARGAWFAKDDLTLRRRAVRVLSTVREPASGPPLLEFMERDAEDRRIGPTAFAALARLGSPWRERALEIAYRSGAPGLWDVAADAIGASAPGAAGALAWWALLAETGGPRLTKDMPQHARTEPWELGRRWLEEGLRVEDVPDGSPRVTWYGPLQGAVDHAIGTIPVPFDASPVLPMDAVALTGRTPAAESRCVLASAGHAPYRAAVLAEVASPDPLLAATAKHCGGVAERTVDRTQALRDADAFVENARAGRVEVAGGLCTAARLLVSFGDEGMERLFAALARVRPPESFYRDLDCAYDALKGAASERLVEATKRLLASADPGDTALARHLIHRSRDPAYLDALEAALAKAEPREMDALRRTLWWIHTGSHEMEPLRREAFAHRFAAWVDEAPDASAAGLLTGLLDLGEPGAAAYARGLRGPRRRLFVDGLAAGTRPVLPEVAIALFEGLDRSTPVEERRAAWIAAYRVAPAASAPALAAAIERMDPAVRAEARDVLEVVRHRAAR